MDELTNIPAPKLALCQKLAGNRLKNMPEHDLFQYLKRQLEYIQDNINTQGKLSQEVFDRLSIGVLCVRELEHIDDEFCNAVYEMLEEVGPKVNWDF